MQPGASHIPEAGFPLASFSRVLRPYLQYHHFETESNPKSYTNRYEARGICVPWALEHIPNEKTSCQFPISVQQNKGL